MDSSNADLCGRSRKVVGPGTLSLEHHYRQASTEHKLLIVYAIHERTHASRYETQSAEHNSRWDAILRNHRENTHDSIRNVIRERNHAKLQKQIEN